MCPTCPFVQVEVKKAEPRDSKAPGQLGPGQWAPRGILTAANGWATQPAQGWQQPYGPQGECLTVILWSVHFSGCLSSIYSLFSLSKGVWVSTTGQPIGGCSASSETSLYSLCCLMVHCIACVCMSFVLLWHAWVFHSVWPITDGTSTWSQCFIMAEAADNLLETDGSLE